LCVCTVALCADRGAPARSDSWPAHGRTEQQADYERAVQERDAIAAQQAALTTLVASYEAQLEAARLADARHAAEVDELALQLARAQAGAGSATDAGPDVVRLR
jgi:hypothetical protein